MICKMKKTVSLKNKKLEKSKNGWFCFISLRMVSFNQIISAVTMQLETGPVALVLLSRAPRG